MIWLIFILAVLLVFGVLTASADLDVSTIGFLSSDVIQTNSVFWLLSFFWIACALLSQKFWQKSKTTVGLIKNLSFGGFIFSTLGFLGLFVIQTLVIYQDFYQKIPKESYTVTATVRILEVSDSVYDEKLGTHYRQKAVISDLKFADNTHRYAQNAYNSENPFYTPEAPNVKKNITLPKELTVLLTANAKKDQLSNKKSNTAKSQSEFLVLNQLVPNTQTTMTLVISPVSKEIGATGFDGYRWLATRHIHANAKILSVEDKIVSAQASDVDIYLQTLRQTLRNHFYQGWHNLSEEQRQAKAVILSLLTGDRALINKDTKDLYQTAGISHLLAISGTHVVFLAICLALLVVFVTNKWFYNLYLFVSSNTLRLCVMIGVSLIYAMFTGFEVPAMRTVYMLIAAVMARRLAMPFATHQILAVTALVMIWLDPFVVWQAGFWLSFVAVLLLMRYENNTVNDKKAFNIKQQVVDLIKLQTWLFITMLPISVLLFGKVSLWGLGVNLFAVGLFGAIIVPINLMAGMIYSVMPSLATLLWDLSALILGKFHDITAFLTAFNQDLWIYHQLGSIAILFGVLAIIPFVIPIFNKRFTWIALSVLAMMAINKPTQMSNFDIQVLPSDDYGISQILMRQKDADPASVNHQAVWLFVADFSGRINAKHGKILLENLKKQGITHLTGVVMQTPSKQFFDVINQLNSKIPIHRYWQAGAFENQSTLAMSACADGQVWQGDGLSVRAITGWQEIDNQMVWGCSLKIISNQKPTIKNALIIHDNLDDKQTYQIIINGAADKKVWQIFDKICPVPTAQNSIDSTDVWITHTQGAMISEILARANPASMVFTDKNTSQNHQKAQQIMAEILP